MSSIDLNFLQIRQRCLETIFESIKVPFEETPAFVPFRSEIALAINCSSPEAARQIWQQRHEISNQILAIQAAQWICVLVKGCPFYPFWEVKSYEKPQTYNLMATHSDGSIARRLLDDEQINLIVEIETLRVRLVSAGIDRLSNRLAFEWIDESLFPYWKNRAAFWELKNELKRQGQLHRAEFRPNDSVFLANRLELIQYQSAICCVIWGLHKLAE